MTYEIFNENHFDRLDPCEPFPGKYQSAAADAAAGSTRSLLKMQ